MESGGTGTVWVDAQRGVAGRGDDVLPLSPHEAAVLAVLAESSGRVVPRTELARRAGLARAGARRCDSLLVGIRRALGPDSVRNVRGRGWMLTVDVAVVHPETG